MSRNSRPTRVTIVLELPSATPFVQLMFAIRAAISGFGGTISAITFGDRIRRQP